MNKQEYDVLNAIQAEGFVNQRQTADVCGHSLGVVNRSIKSLQSEGYIGKNSELTKKALSEYKKKAPARAIILAAGIGMRMVPINMEIPKALLEVNGERIIERQINQLHEVGITEIYVLVGFMKERFEYLIDKYGVKLIVNSEYAVKNNIHTLKLAARYISNAYIVPCDVWCVKNPFRRNELYSWYMVGDTVDEESDVRVNRKAELVKDKSGGNAMIGISYILDEDAAVIKEQIAKLCADANYDDAFWEEALYHKDRMTVVARVVNSADFIEINTYEQLRELDSGSRHLETDAISAITEVFNVSRDEISDITVLKKGMTNRSFMFSHKGARYIMRIPGEGTDRLISRENEACVYRAIAGKGLCDEPLYINPSNGYKITKFLEGVRVCDSENEDDLRKCMAKLRAFHEMKLKVEHEFDIFGQIEFYESLRNGAPSVYEDYAETVKNVFSLRPYIEAHAGEKCLVHIDAVPDNFLFYDSGNGEELQLTDWEYAGMQDPHVDIAMFCIYSLYDREQIDRLISIYFDGKCDEATRTKIYCYISACGLLWSNWCEYKHQLGVEFGEYGLKQYRYAKEYYRTAAERIGSTEGDYLK